MTAHIFADNIRELSSSSGTGDFVTTGGSVVVPTAAIGRAISSVASTGDTFDYVIHHTTLDEWEIGVGTYSGTNTFTRTRVVSSSNGNSTVDFSTGQKAVWIGPTSEIRQWFADIENVVTYGATAGGSNSTQLAAARTHAGVNKPIFAPSNSGSTFGVKQGTTGDFGGDSLGEGRLFSASQGTNSFPATTSNPLIYLEKYTQGGGGSVNDHGGIDVRVKRVAGSNYTYGAYFAAEDAGGTAGRVAAFAALLNTTNTDAVDDVAAVFFAQKSVATANGTVTALHVDIYDNSGQDNGWQATGGVGCTYAMNVQTAGGQGTIGHRISSTGISGVGFYTGMLIDTNAVLPNTRDMSGNAEAIRIRGGSDTNLRYTGLWMQDGYLAYGINLVGPNYGSNTMMLLPKDNYITFGTSAAASTKVSWKSSGDKFDINAGVLSISGTQVIGARITGWTACTGTPSRAGFDTSTADVTSLAQTLKALIDDLETHGVIGT